MPTSTTEPFDRLPDHILLHILNLVGDVRSLARCRCVNRKLISLVRQADDLRLRVDAVVLASREPQLLPLLHHLFTSILTTISSFISFTSYPKSHPSQTNSQLTSLSPSSSLEIPLRGFGRIRRLEIELPVVDHKTAGGLMRWKAEFGAKFKGCVILLARKMGREGVDENMQEVEVGLKETVIATIGVLMAASARHEMVKKMVRGECGEGMEEVVVRDRDGEWTVAMDSEGVSECRESADDECDKNYDGYNLREITVPAVRLRIRCAKKLEFVGGVSMAEAALVVVTAFERKEVEQEEEEVVAKVFDGVYREAVEGLLKKNCYRLEMNSL